MELSDRSKILILVVLVAVVLYLLFTSNKSAHNEGMLTQDVRINPSPANIINIGKNLNSSKTNTAVIDDIDISRADSEKSSQSDKSLGSTTEDTATVAKMIPKSPTRGNGAKRVNYEEGERNAKFTAIDKFFEGNSPMDDGAEKGFGPTSDGGQYASYLPGKNYGKKLTDKDKFDPGTLLPDEKDQEWFDQPHKSSTINVKSRHLINISRPVGVNTVGQSLKNANRQLRADPPNPKTLVSPWGNSSIEPDTNIKSMCI